MQVLIPHPTELISLTILQKELIEHNFSSECLLSRILPLWIDLPFSSNVELSKSELKITASRISEIELKEPEISKNKNYIFCPVTLIINETEFISELKLVKIHNPQNITLKKINTEEINFPLCLKIFRIGNKIELPEQKAQAIQDFVWKKL